MGTDIHGVFQRHNKETGAWEDIEHKYEMDRHYLLFAVLAGVRNGRCFAGVKTVEAVAPIAEPRGYPEGFPLAERLGDHSHSWLTGEEMLAWFASTPVVVQTGVLSRDEYERWDKKSAPDNYCGDVSGRDVVVVSDTQIARALAPNWNYIRCEWDASLRDELTYFFDEVARLQAEHGQVRFVFGFDS